MTGETQTHTLGWAIKLYLGRKRERRNETWVFGEKDTFKSTEMVLEVSIKAGFPIESGMTVAVKLIYPPSTRVPCWLFQPEAGCNPISQLPGLRYGRNNRRI